jgi:phosphoglucomutase
VEGATVRLYLEKYEEPSGELDKYVLDLVKPLAALALSFSDLAAMTGRTEPSVIT